MYSIDWALVRFRLRRGANASSQFDGVRPESTRLPLISGTVWGLGVTSFFTDLSSEMVASVLPVYLVLHLRLSPLAFGFVDGTYQGAAALVRVVAGLTADRWVRHKEVAAAGYGLSAACRVFILASGAAWSTIAVVIAIDRVGKGIRTAPRDALISLRTRPRDLATAFGLHRTFDAGGAMLGPVVAFALLALVPDRFDVLFLTSFAFAVLGLGAILLLVPGSRPDERPSTSGAIALGASAALLGNARFRRLVISSLILGLGTMSDSFIFLSLQRRLDVSATAFPLLYVGTASITALLAAPCGRLADRLGRKTVLLCGYCALALLYVSLVAPANGLVLVSTAIALLGLYYAATDGVLTAMTAAVLPPANSGAGLAVLATAINVGRLTSSVACGWLWLHVGLTQATVIYLAAVIAAILVVLAALPSSKHHA